MENAVYCELMRATDIRDPEWSFKAAIFPDLFETFTEECIVEFSYYQGGHSPFCCGGIGRKPIDISDWDAECIDELLKYITFPYTRGGDVD